MKPSTRRDFLKFSAAAGLAAQAGPLAGNLFAAPAAYSRRGGKTMVVIYLRGGADPLHMLVPYGDEHYRRHRPTLRMSLEDGLIQLDDMFGLHPAMGGLQRAWNDGALAPIACAGSVHPTRSHFDAQDWMEFAAPGNRTVRDGWLNRYLASTHTEDASEFRALGMQELLPRSLRGLYPVLAVPRSMNSEKGDRTLDTFEKFYGDGSDIMEGGSEMMGRREEDAAGVVESGRITIETLRRFREIVSGQKKRQAGDTVSGSVYPEGGFGSALEQIALVIKADAGLEVAGLDYGGWDDHTNQGDTEGRMADRMRSVFNGLGAFYQDLGPRMKDTTVLVMTEFGRTVKENGNGGTDHGHGGSMWVLGGGVKGGKVHGTWDGLERSALYQGRDLPTNTDFRDVFATVMANGLEFEPGADFFPDHKPRLLKDLY